MIPILMSGVHGAAGKVVTPEMVRSIYKRGQGRKVPVVVGHPEDDPVDDDERALGTVTIERLVEPYVDESGVQREVAILGRPDLNERGKKAVRDQDFIYYSPAIKHDEAAGYIMRHVGFVNDPAQAGLPALQDLIILSDKGFRLALYDKAPEDTPWEFSGADYDIQQLVRASAVVDGLDGNPHTAAVPEGLTKEACHLPHHKPDGTLVWRGVAAAAAALAGSRGGVKISDDAQTRAHAHLAKHYGEFGRELKEGKMPDVKLFDEESLGQLKTVFQETITAALAPLLEKLTPAGEPTEPADEGNASDEGKAELSDLRKKVSTLEGQVKSQAGEVTASKFLAEAVDKGCPREQAVILSEMVKADPKVLSNAVKLADQAAAGQKLLGGITVNLTDEAVKKGEADYNAGAKAGAKVK